MINSPEIIEQKMTNHDVLQLYVRLSALRNVPGFKLNYAISRTLKNLAAFPRAYTKDRLIPKSTSYVEYEKELFDGYKAIAGKGTVIEKTQGAEYERLDLDVNCDAAKAVRAELQEKYSTAIEERQRQEEDYAAWLDEECGDAITIYKVKVSDMPAGDGDYKAVWDACALMIDFEETTKTE